MRPCTGRYVYLGLCGGYMKKQFHYSVGVDPENKYTFLRLHAEDGSSMTLEMNQNACERLIKMLRATYEETTEESKDD